MAKSKATAGAKKAKGRRGHGEGTIYFDEKKGRYCAQINLGRDPVTGKRKRPTVYGKTQAEVIEKRDELKRQAATGVLTDGAKVKLSEYLPTWLETAIKPPKRSLSTYVGYEGIVRNHLVPVLGDIRLKDLTPLHIERLYQAKQADGLTTQVVRIHAALHRALRQAVLWGYLPYSPADRVEPPKAESKEGKPFTFEQARAFERASRSSRWHALYFIAVAMGLRPGEATGLSWDALTLDSKPPTVFVNQALSEVGSHLNLKGLKQGKKGKRTLELPAAVVPILQRQRKAQLEERLQAGADWKNEWNLVFTMDDGAPIKRYALRKDFSAAIKAAGLEPVFRRHDLRHTAATLLLAKHLPMKYIQKLLGHSTMAITSDIYSHVTVDMQHETADQMQEILSGFAGDDAAEQQA